MSAPGWVVFVGAAAAGATLRYVVDNLVAARLAGAFPWGTFVVNVTGSLLSGLVAGLAVYHGLPADARTVVATGFLGSYTTFSTFVFETVRLAEEGAADVAARNIAGTFLACALAAGAGLALAAL